MFSEIASTKEAEGLLKVLVAAVNSKNLEHIEFCRLHIMPLYDSALSNTYSPEFVTSDDYEMVDSYFKKLKPLNRSADDDERNTLLKRQSDWLMLNSKLSVLKIVDFNEYFKNDEYGKKIL